jgi:hypothetical protein
VNRGCSRTTEIERRIGKTIHPGTIDRGLSVFKQRSYTHGIM